jgi:hypothetical protein
MRMVLTGTPANHATHGPPVAGTTGSCAGPRPNQEEICGICEDILLQKVLTVLLSVKIVPRGLRTVR